MTLKMTEWWHWYVALTFTPCTRTDSNVHANRIWWFHVKFHHVLLMYKAVRLSQFQNPFGKMKGPSLNFSLNLLIQKKTLQSGPDEVVCKQCQRWRVKMWWWFPHDASLWSCLQNKKKQSQLKSRKKKKRETHAQLKSIMNSFITQLSFLYWHWKNVVYKKQKWQKIWALR